MAVGVRPAGTRWLEVWVRGGYTPWNDGTSLVSVSRKGGLLSATTASCCRISPATGREIRAGLPLG